LTGGEPLVRKNILHLVRSIGRDIETGHLDELTLTTNSSQPSRFAQELYDAGVSPLQCLARHARSAEIQEKSTAGAISPRLWKVSTLPRRPV